jgi:peptide subunit release factor 1 (eRF1)
MISIADLASYKGQGTSLVTLTLPSTTQLSLVVAKIRKELSTATNVQSRV